MQYFICNQSPIFCFCGFCVGVLVLFWFSVLLGFVCLGLVWVFLILDPGTPTL